MRAKHSLVNSSDDILRLASAAAASVSVQSSGSDAASERDAVPTSAAIATAPANKLRRVTP
jgi:hypothetical protein